MTPGFRRSLKVNLHRPFELNTRFAPGVSPTLIKGKNLTVSKIGTGHYRITLQQAAGGVEGIQVSPSSATGAYIADYKIVDSQHFDVYIYDSTFAASDAADEVSVRCLLTESTNEQ